MERVRGDGDGAIVEELTYTSKDSKGIKDGERSKRVC